MNLTETDHIAISHGDDGYLVSKGGRFYVNKEYKNAIKYYHLASAAGNVAAVSNLGYCYLYGRDTEPDIDLGIAYFTIAAHKGDVDAAYKLGNIYSTDKWGVKDEEKSFYFYRMALSFLFHRDGDEIYVIDKYSCSILEDYPSLALAIGKEFLNGNYFAKDYGSAYYSLIAAKKGYECVIHNGEEYYRDSLEETNKLLENEKFDMFKNEEEQADSDEDD